MSVSSRRRFLTRSACGVVAANAVPLVPGLSNLSAEEVKLEAEMVQFRPEIEPLVNDRTNRSQRRH